MGSGSDETAASKQPSRGIAIVLHLLGPLGLGQFYLGQKRRAAWWLLLVLGAFVALGFALPVLGASVGYGKTLVLMVVAAFAAWITCLIDVLVTPSARMTRVPRLVVFGFWCAGTVLGVGLRTVLRRYAIEAFEIPGGSMQPTLLVGEHIMADRAALRGRPPLRGEAIVFTAPVIPEQDFLKRVVALPGDVLDVRSGHPWLNGWEVPHCPLGKTTLPDARPGCSGTVELEFLDAAAYLVFFDECSDDGKQGPYRVAPGEVWVLGDNRNNSFDSRAWFDGRGGGVPLANVKGLGLFRWYSPSDWSRNGTAFADPILPASMATLRANFEKCLATRPPGGKTLPPSSH
jgi:signal peptidase I